MILSEELKFEYKCIFEPWKNFYVEEQQGILDWWPTGSCEKVTLSNEKRE